jgi:hypothetical protein
MLMTANLKDKLIACLMTFKQPALRPVIKALKQTTQPIQNDEKLSRFFKLLFKEVPELEHDPKIKKFNQGLKPNLAASSYQAKKR